MKTRPLIALALIVVAIIGGAMWFLQTQPAPTPLPDVPTTAKAPDRPAQSLPAPTRTASTQSAQKPAAEAESEPAKPAAPQQMEEWEIKIDQVLQANTGETETAQILISMLPTLPPDGQAEAAQHISNLIQDEDYNRVMPLLRNTALSEEVQDVLVTDLMNREDKVKLPALLEVAKISNHPHQEEALTDLEIFLDEDYGTNWAMWEAKMKQYLKEQEAEEMDVDSVATPAAGNITQ